jgi:hypothetical protein
VLSVKGKIINLLVIAKYALAEVRRLLPGGHSTPAQQRAPRHLPRRFRVTARDIERTLFRVSVYQRAERDRLLAARGPMPRSAARRSKRLLGNGGQPRPHGGQARLRPLVPARLCVFDVYLRIVRTRRTDISPILPRWRSMAVEANAPPK